MDGGRLLAAIRVWARRAPTEAFVFVAAASAVAALGFVGFSDVRSTWSGFDRAYLTLQLFTVESGNPGGSVPWTLGVARFLAPVVTLIAAAEVLRTLARYVRDGEFRVRSRGHVVVCGLGQGGSALVQALSKCATGSRAVAVTLDPHNAEAARARALGVRVVIGDATSPKVLERADADAARAIVALCGDDTVNAEIVHAVADIADSVPVLFGVRDRWLASQLTALFAEGDRNRSVTVVNLGQDLGEHAIELTPEALEGASLVVGFGTLGQELALALLSRSPQTSVIAVDSDAERKVGALCALDPARAGRIVGHSCDFVSAEFHERRFLEDRDDISAIFVTVDDDALGLAVGLQLSKALVRPVAVRVSSPDRGLARLAASAKISSRDVRLYGPANTADRLIERIEASSERISGSRPLVINESEKVVAHDVG